jgi:hypothetical protein
MDVCKHVCDNHLFFYENARTFENRMIDRPLQKHKTKFKFARDNKETPFGQYIPEWGLIGCNWCLLGLIWNHNHSNLLALPTKDIVFRFIIEYSSFRDFAPLGNKNNNNSSIFIWGLLKHDIWACVETWD